MSDYYEIWCDGACEGNGKPDGVAAYGIIRRHDGGETTLSGFAPGGTNNCGELVAACVALESVPEKSVVTIHTDSKYVLNGVTEWVGVWKVNGWRTRYGNPVKNRELWERLDALNHRRSVDWKWVRGHSGVPQNERCDALAVAAIQRHKFTSGSTEIPVTDEK